ncbi:hypothetical protein JXO59_01365 [candidate division KSB1 bacterium]|nr:hypothetical protein [candidate division KSB1 bacterium]
MLKNAKKIVLAWSLIAWCCSAVQAQNQALTIAIADFRNSTGRFVNDRLEKTVPELLKTELAQTRALTVVERSRLEAIFNEQALGQSGVLDTYRAQQVGRLVGAQYVISGELTRTGDRFRVDAHIVRVETGEVVGEKVTGPNEGAIEAMIRILAQNIAYNLTGQGKTVLKDRVHRYPYHWPLICAVGTGIAAGILHSNYERHYQDYRSARSLDEMTRSYDDANKNYRARNYVIGAAVLCLSTGVTLWLKNRHQGNMIIAQGQRIGSGRLVCTPAFDPSCNFIGINITWMH